MQNGDMFIFLLRSFRKMRFLKNAVSRRWCEMQCTVIFSSVKKDNFHLKKKMIFFFNIDCGYTLESPHPGGFNEYPQSIGFNEYPQYVLKQK